MEYYYIKPFNFDYQGKNEVFNKINNNTFIHFDVLSGDTYMFMLVKNISQFKNIYIKEISCKIDDTSVCLLKDKYYEIDDTELSLGEIEKKVMKILLKKIGKNKTVLPIIQEYILDNGDLIREEYIYCFEYKSRIAWFLAK